MENKSNVMHFLNYGILKLHGTELCSGTEFVVLRSKRNGFLDPREMGSTVTEKNLERRKAVLRQLNEANRVLDNDVDEILQQYSLFCQAELLVSLGSRKKEKGM